ncbi:peptide/nickel transport system permease protein [Rhizobiales bacterium GAS191]|nr:peptide/nickel transport system permease protein [Rhizobiales bacterium GAS191]
MSRPASLMRGVLSTWRSRISALLLVIVFAAAVAAPVVSPYRYDQQSLQNARKPPSAVHWLGTDELGRDVLARVMYGARTSLGVACLSISVSVLLGVILGAVAAYYRGWIDWMISSAVDLLWSFPHILLALMLIAILGPDLFTIILAIAMGYLAKFTRLTRTQVLGLRSETFIEATRSLGASDLRVLLRHLLPNSLSAVIVAGMLGIGDAIVLEATLGFFGLGAQPPTPSWGAMMSSGTGLMFLAPWVIMFPGLAATVTVVCINLLGDSLLSAFDVRTRERIT